MVREKIPRSEKSQELHFEPAKNLSLWKNSGNSEILRVHMYFSRLFLRCKILCTFYGHESCCIGRILFMKLNDKLMFGISRKSILFARYGFRTINSCTLQVTCWNQVGWFDVFEGSCSAFSCDVTAAMVFQNNEKDNLVPRAFPLKNGWGGKRPWHRLVTCPLVHPKILGVIN